MQWLFGIARAKEVYQKQRPREYVRRPRSQMQRGESTMPLCRAALFTAVVTTGALVPRTLALPGAGANGPLLPLRDLDEQSTQETGCTSTFSVGSHDYLQLVGTKLPLRDSHGLRFCQLSARATEDLENARGSIACSGYRLSVRSSGRAVSNVASDSSARRATLAIAQNGVATSLRGIWGVSC